MAAHGVVASITPNSQVALGNESVSAIQAQLPYQQLEELERRIEDSDLLAICLD